MEAIFNLMTSLSHHWVTVAANSIWIGALLTGLAWLMRRSAKSVNAATGYLVWWTVLALVIVSPFLMGGPSTDAPYQAIERHEPWAPVSTVQLVMLPESKRPDRTVIAVPDPDVVAKPENEMQTALTAIVSEEPRSHEHLVGATGQIESETGPSMLSVLARLLPVSLLALWTCIALALVIRIWLAYRRMVAIKRRSQPFDALRFPRVDGLLRRAAIRRKTKLHLTDEVGSPVAAGLGHPIILIPRKMSNQLTERELEAVVVHELAHILRWDDWTKLAQKLIEAFLFFNPVVRWIGRQLELEREIACDDRVVAQTGEPTEYARCLTRLTELATIPNASLIPGVLTGRKQIFRRFEQLLNGKRRTEIRFCRSRFACAIAAVLMVAVVAVRVVPVVALPAEAVNYNEFSQAVESVAAKFIPESAPSDAGVNKDQPFPDDAANELVVEPFRFSPDHTNPVDAVLAVATDATDGAANMFCAVTEQLVTEESATSDTVPHSSRVVDWNDDMFDLPITGTIHGSGGRDDAIEVWINDEQTIRTAMKGRVRFTPDGRDVKSISQGGFLAIKEEHDAIWKEVDVRRGNDGTVEYNYFVGGKQQPYDKDAQKLLATVIRRLAPEPLAGVTPVPDAPGAHVVSPGITAAPAIAPGAPVVAATPSPSVQRAPHADPPEPRIGREGFLSRVIDWAANPFDLDGTGLMISDNDEETSILWSDGRNKIKVKMEGEVEFTDDDQSIKSISQRGYFAIWEKDGSTSRELTVEPDRDGTLEYGYYENGKSLPFDEAAEEWLADILVDVIRKTGVGAKPRAERILREHGVDGVLAEIKLIESNYVKRIYFDAILDNATLSNAEYASILELVGLEIDSDYDKAEILVAMADRVSENSALIHDYVGVVATIDSDYESRRALAAVSLGEDVDPEVTDAVLAIAGNMDSDYEKAELLIAMAPYCQAEGALQTSYVNAVIGIESDYEARRVLSALSLNGNVDPATTYAVMEIIGGFDSDYEMAELLIEMAPFIGDHPESQDAYLTAVARIGSDYEIKRTLVEFIDKAEMTDTCVLAILPTVEAMSSSYEQSEILKELAPHCRGNDALEDAFLDVVETMDSDYESNQLYRQLYRRDRGEQSSDQ